MTQFNDPIALFANYNSLFGTPSPDQTGDLLGVWPPAGTHPCMITSFTETQTKITWKDEAGKQSEIPAMRYQFHYQLVADPDNIGIWHGAPIDVPAGPLPENRTWIAQRDTNRLAGCIKTILGVVPDNLGAGIQTLKSNLASGSKYVVEVLIQEQPSTKPGGRPFKKEFQQRLLSR
jgi:hypothetical protein